MRAMHPACLSAGRRAALRGLVGLALAVPLAAPRRARAGAIDQFRDFATNTRSARGEFVQRTARSGGLSPEQASGQFAFSRPGRFRWEVRRPFEQLLVADGERLWFFDRDLNQVTVRRLAQALGATPAAILFGGGDPARDFALREIPGRDGQEWLEAIPKSRDAGFERIALGFRNGLPEAMEVRDAFGRTTTFAFRGVERNVAVDADAFRFVPPRGADLLEQ